MKGGTDLKITAGLGRVEDYPAFIHAGADEVFCGYVPDRWYEHFNMSSPLNRREVRYAHVQIGSRNELKILHSMTEDFGAPAVLTMNALFYLPNQYPIIHHGWSVFCADHEKHKFFVHRTRRKSFGFRKENCRIFFRKHSD